jgi:hypothetical protein
MTKKTPKFKSSYNLGLKIMKQTPLNPTHLELSNNTYKTIWFPKKKKKKNYKKFIQYSINSPP